MKVWKRARKMERESSTTCGTLETPFFDSATHRYCFTAPMNTSSALKTCRTIWRERGVKLPKREEGVKVTKEGGRG